MKAEILLCTHEGRVRILDHVHADLIDPTTLRISNPTNFPARARARARAPNAAASWPLIEVPAQASTDYQANTHHETNR